MDASRLEGLVSTTQAGAQSVDESTTCNSSVDACVCDSVYYEQGLALLAGSLKKLSLLIVKDPICAQSDIVTGHPDQGCLQLMDASRHEGFVSTTQAGA
jgi:hypothetical protein